MDEAAEFYKVVGRTPFYGKTLEILGLSENNKKSFIQILHLRGAIRKNGTQVRTLENGKKERMVFWVFTPSFEFWYNKTHNGITTVKHRRTKK